MPKHLIQAGSDTKVNIEALITAIEGQWYWTTDTDEYYFGKTDGTVAGPVPGGTDSQTLSFANPNLSISGGNSIDISDVNYWNESGSVLYTPTNYKVGIGTSTPAHLLEIEKNGFGGSITPFKIRNSGSGNIYTEWSNTAHTWNFMIEGGEYKIAKSGFGASLRLADNSFVAIGNVTPTQLLHVDGSTRIDGHIYDKNNVKGTYDQVLRARTNGIEWVDEAAHTLSFVNPNLSITGGNTIDISSVNYWDIAGSDIYYSGGNIGVGTAFPFRIFEVRGSTPTDFNPFRFRNTDIGDVWLEIQNNTRNWQYGIKSGHFTFWNDTEGNQLQLHLNGNTGIGGTPTQHLDVFGDIRLRGHIWDVNASTGTTGQFLKRIATGTEWADATGLWSQNGTHVYYNGGNVGIGTDTPDEWLHIDGGATNAVIHLEGNTTTYANAYIRMTANNNINNKALGVYMFDAGGDIEWYMGRGSTGSDRFVVARKSTAAHAISTVADANILFQIDSAGDFILDSYSNTRSDITTHDPDNHIYFDTTGKLLVCDRLYQYVKITNTAITQELNNVAWTEVTAFDNEWKNTGGFSYEGGSKHKIKMDEDGLYEMKLALNITSTGTDVGLEVGIFINGGTTPYQTNYYGHISGSGGQDITTIVGEDLLDLLKNDYITIKCRRYGTATTSIKLAATNKSHFSFIRQSIG